MLYIKRIVKQDLNKEIAFPSQYSKDAFSYDAFDISTPPREIVLTYSIDDEYSCKGEKVYLNIHIPGNGRGDEGRFSKPLQNFLNSKRVQEGDLIIFVCGKSLTEYDFYCISKDSERFSVYEEILSQTDKTRDNHNHKIVDYIIDTVSTEHIKNSNFKSYLSAIRTKPFILLAGISGTGKSRIVRKLAQATVTEELQEKYDSISVENGFNRWEINKPVNFEMIQVKPNWHNSMELIGYKSNINGEHYEFTPFVDFIVKAWMHQDVPFFLCLDEMNLAPVEQYFAEFLSAIESRSIENGEYITDPIIKPFDSFGSAVAGDMIGRFNSMRYNLPTTIENHFRTKGLTLPKNLIVMGTVNMDETTFTFSRKVLDRAMSIEMNEVNYENFFEGVTENDVPELSDDIKYALINRPLKGLQAPDNDANVVKDYLKGIDGVLQGTPFQLGYRAINEALLYVSASRILGNENTNEALDRFTLMKILSRLEGDKRSLVTADNRELLPALTTIITSEKYPISYKKLDGMIKTLNHKQFVSYWT